MPWPVRHEGVLSRTVQFSPMELDTAQELGESAYRAVGAIAAGDVKIWHWVD